MKRAAYLSLTLCAFVASSLSCLQMPLLARPQTDDSHVKIEELLKQAHNQEMAGAYRAGRNAYEQALRLCNVLLDEHPDDVEALTEKGNSLRALAHDRKILARKHPLLFAHYSNEQLLSLNEDAIRSYDRALKLNPANVQALFGKAVAFKNCGDIQAKLWNQEKAKEDCKESISNLEQVLVKDPMCKEAELERGIAYEALGDRCRYTQMSIETVNESYLQARSSYDRALGLASEKKLIYMHIGSTMEKIGRMLRLSGKPQPEKAMRESIWSYDQALQLSPDDVNTLYRKATAQQCAGQILELQRKDGDALEMYGEAVRTLDVLIGMRPKSADAYREKGEVLTSIAEIQSVNIHKQAVDTINEAVQCLRKALRICPWPAISTIPFAMALHTQLNILGQGNDEENALASIKQASKLTAWPRSRAKIGEYLELRELTWMAKQEEQAGFFLRALASCRAVSRAYEAKLTEWGPSAGFLGEDLGYVLTVQGGILVKLERNSEALDTLARANRAFDKGVNHYPKEAWILVNKADNLLKLANLERKMSMPGASKSSMDEALLACDKALKLDPHDKYVLDLKSQLCALLSPTNSN
jgi:tetratricopeptide (TPR) repeat protein